MPSELEVVTNQFYSNLQTLDNHTIRRMAIAHRIAVKNLNTEFARVSAIIAKDAKLGLNSGAYILQQQRLASMIGQARTQFEKFGSVVGETISDTQLKAAKLAESTMPKYVEAINGPAPVGFAFNRFPEASFQQMVGHLTDGSPLATLTKSFGDEAATKLNAVLATGMALGKSPLVVARQMRDVASGLGAARARTIARTEMLRAYRESNRRTMLANADVVKGWRWHSALDDRTCAVCYAMHGRTFKLQASMATHPNCRCTQIPITKSWKELGFKGVSDLQLPYKATVDGETWFKGLSQLQQRRVLGKGGQLAYEKGLVKLDDFVLDTYSPQWGYGRVKRSLRSIVGTDNARLLSRGIVPKSVQANNAKLRLMLVEDNPFQRQFDYMDKLLAEKRLMQYEYDSLEGMYNLGHYADAGQFQAAIEGVRDAPYVAFEKMLDDAVAKFGLDADIADGYKTLSINADREHLNDLVAQAKADISVVETAYNDALMTAKLEAWDEIETAKWLGHVDDTAYSDYTTKWYANDMTPAEWNSVTQDLATKNGLLNPATELKALNQQLFDSGAIDLLQFDSFNNSVIGNIKTYSMSDLDVLKQSMKTQLDEWAPVQDVVLDLPNEWAQVSQLFNDGKIPGPDYIAFRNSLVGKPKVQAKIAIDDFANDPKWHKVTKSSQELFAELDLTHMPLADKTVTKQLYKSKQINKEDMQAIIDNAIQAYPPPAPPIATTPTTTVSAFTPPPLSELTFVQDLGGSTGARLMQDVAGNKYVVKKGANLDHLLSESRADDIYDALGIRVPRHAVVGGDTKIAEFIPGRTLNQLSGAERQLAEAALQENFAADALMGNWDVIGMNADNILVDNAGKVYRIDNGGSLSFRAQGAKKSASQWDATVGELDTMRNGTNMASKVFGSLSDADVVKQIDKLVANRMAIHDAAVKFAGYTDANTLMDRLDYLEQWAAAKKKALNMPKVTIAPKAAKNITQQIEMPPFGLLDETDSLPFLDFAEQAGYITDVEKADFIALINTEGWKSVKVATETTKFLKANGVPHNALQSAKPFRLPHGNFDNSVDAWKAVNDAWTHGLVPEHEVKNLINDGIVSLGDPDDVQAAKLHAWLKSRGVPEAGVKPQAAFATIDDAMAAVKQGYYDNKITYTQYKKIQKQYWKAQNAGNWNDALSADEFILAAEKRLGIKRPKPLKAAKTPFKKHTDKMDTLLKTNKLTQKQYDFILDEYAAGRWVNKDIDSILSQYDAPGPNYGGVSGLPQRFVPSDGPNWYQQWDYDGFMGNQYSSYSGGAYRNGRGYTWFENWKQSATGGAYSDTRLYTSDYRDFNRWLRGGRPSNYNSSDYTRRIDNMDKAFASPAARSTEEMVVYRGTDLRDTHAWWNADVGDVIQDDGVMSTSVGSSAAFSGNLRFVAYVPEDANAIWIAPGSHHPGEREVLFKPGQQWIVHHKEIDTSGYTKRMTLVVEYLETQP